MQNSFDHKVECKEDGLLDSCRVAHSLGSKPVVGEHVLFLSGNNVGNLAWATPLLTSWFGRRHIINLGDITAARGAEMHIILWNTLSGILGTPLFNI